MCKLRFLQSAGDSTGSGGRENGAIPCNHASSTWVTALPEGPGPVRHLPGQKSLYFPVDWSRPKRRRRRRRRRRRPRPVGRPPSAARTCQCIQAVHLSRPGIPDHCSRALQLRRRRVLRGRRRGGLRRRRGGRTSAAGERQRRCGPASAFRALNEILGRKKRREVKEPHDKGRMG